VRLTERPAEIQSGGLVANSEGCIPPPARAEKLSRSDPLFDPGVTNGLIEALAVTGTTVYLAGTFTSVGGVARSGLAAVDASGVLTPWNPNPGPNVIGIVLCGSSVCAAGSFKAMGLEPAGGFARIPQ
jgi:hypothetical protein